MVCIYCSGPTSVVNSRAQRRSNHIWRRRKCALCASVFTSEERAELASSVMVSRPGGALVPFSRDRLFVTVHDSCKHRPNGIEDAAALTQTIISMLRSKIRGGILQRADIVQAARSVLGRFDNTAATVYAAYHPESS